MKAVKRIFNIASSMIELTGETMERLDIQEYKMGIIQGYCGYLHTNKNVYIIRQDGTFEVKA